MARPNFFCGVDALQWLLEHEPKSERDDIDLTVDLIELPLLFIYTSDDEAWQLKAMMRGELYDHKSGSGVERGSLRVVKATGEGSGTSSSEDLRDNMGAFFEACRRLSRWISDENLQPLYEGLDPEEAGILLAIEGDRLTARVVQGEERPELMCERLFGGTIMMRPYMEDFMERSMVDEMSLEEKIEAGESGDKFAMAKLADAYLNGTDDVEADPAKAAYWFRKETELEDSEGAFNLGLLYAKGYGVERDFAEAAAWMEKAVAWGDPDGEGPAKLYRELLEKQTKAEAGDPEAMAALAGGYMSLGNSLDQAGPGEDYKMSLHWANKAVDAGCAAGYWPLALAYEHGRGVDQDHAKATELFRKGAELGDKACQHSYGCRFTNGDGVPYDWEQAFDLFQKSAAQGYGLAMRDLGRCYQFGNGCVGNLKTALEWYEKADAVLDDPEVHRRVEVFRLLMEKDPRWAENYDGQYVENYAVGGERYARQWVEMERQRRAENRKHFLETHGGLLARDAAITLRDKRFVEDGLSSRKDWEEISRRVTEGGGVFRSAVSGKTDYLVCDPDFASDGAVLAARTQQIKGKPVRIVLVSDLLRALGMEPDPEPEESAENDSAAPAPSVEEAYAAVLGDEGEAPAAPAAKDAPFPEAEPGEDQSPHLQFLSGVGGVVGMFGGIVNQNGTEYAFESLREELGYAEPVRSILERSVRLDRAAFPPAERAKEMAELFRVNADAFDPGEDREQQILSGMLRRCTMYHDLRSFAWTLTAWCEENGVAVKNVDIHTLRAVARFVQARDHQNYCADSHCPALCSGPDLHVFFLPEATDEADIEKLLEIQNEGIDGAGKSAAQPLEELRAELTALWPAMEKIHDALLATRDRNRELSGALADVLFAWCSMTYAARDPIFTEDGPMNNFFEHPDQENEWMVRWQKEREEMEKAQAQTWLESHERDLNRGAKILFPGKKFVFDGSPDSDQWIEILEKLTAKGGEHRTAVSGLTDYLVCDPRRAGDSKIQKIKEQRAKGRCRNTKIVLAEEFYRALGVDPNLPKTEEPAQKKPVASVPFDATMLDRELALTYTEGRRCGDGHYTIAIPDGFILKENVEGRAFLAYSPDGTDETDARIVLYDGVRNELAEGQRRALSPEGMVGFFEQAAYNETSVQLFSENGTLPMPEGAPAGVCSYGYDANLHCYHCNPGMVLGNATKLLRVQIGEAYSEDISACERLVLDWLGTIQTEETPWQTPDVDDPVYAGALTAELAERWKTDQANALDVILNDYGVYRDSRVARYKAKAPKNQDSVELLKADLQTLLDQTAAKIGNHFDRALTVLERFCGDETNRTFLPEMVESLGEPMSKTARISITLDENPLEAFIPEKEKLDQRLAALKKGKTLTQLQAEETERLAEQQRQKQEAERRRREEAERKAQEERERLRKQEAERRQAEEALRQKKEEADRQRREDEKRRQAAEAARQALKKQRARAKDAANLLSCSGEHLVAVKADGTVVTAGENLRGRCDVSGWSEIVSVHCDRNNTVALTADGTVKFAGWDNRGQSACAAWTDLRQICVDHYSVFGLKRDGTVLATPAAPMESAKAKDIDTWKNIQEIARGGDLCLGLDKDGKLFSLRRTADGELAPGEGNGQMAVMDAVAGGFFPRCFVLKRDGSCGEFSPEQLGERAIVKLFQLDDLPVALLNDGSFLLPESDRLGHLADFLSKHSDERFIAISGTDEACAMLTEEGRVYVAARADASLRTGEPFGPDFRLFQNYGQLMDDRRGAKQRREDDLRRQEREAQAAKKEAEAAQIKMSSAKKADSKSIGLVLLLLGLVGMIVCMLGAVAANGRGGGLVTPMIISALVFSAGYVMLKDQKKK